MMPADCARSRGGVIGLSGASGIEFILFFPWVAPHLHLNVWLNGEPIELHEDARANKKGEYEAHVEGGRLRRTANVLAVEVSPVAEPEIRPEPVLGPDPGDTVRLPIVDRPIATGLLAGAR